MQSPAAFGQYAQETGKVTSMNFAAGPLRGATAPRRKKAKFFPPVKAYIVEDNVLIRNNLVDTLTELAGVQTIGYSETEQDACDWLVQHPTDWELLIVDLFLLQGSGLNVVKSCGNRGNAWWCCPTTQPPRYGNAAWRSAPTRCSTSRRSLTSFWPFAGCIELSNSGRASLKAENLSFRAVAAESS